MTDVALRGLRVLVVEDDYYLADGVSKALSRTGATVLGPYSSDAGAIAEIEAGKPDCAVLDINTGNGPTFIVARALRRLGAPTVFATGYNPETLPADLAGAVHVSKPFAEEQLLAAVLRALTSTSERD